MDLPAECVANMEQLREVYLCGGIAVLILTAQIKGGEQLRKVLSHMEAYARGLGIDLLCFVMIFVD